MDTSTSPQPDTPQNNNCGNVIGSYNNTWDNCTFSVADKSLHILEWPSPLAPRLRHREVRRSHVGGVGSWLLRTDEFVNWNTGDDGVVSPVLFSYGDPGVGKTHISSLIIDTLCQSVGEQVAVACLYCDFQSNKEQSTIHMFGAILKQVVSGFDDIPHEIKAAFRRSRKQIDSRELELVEILKLLISSLRNMKRSYICIDALDEFPREYRPELFKSLLQVIQESPSTRLFLTGRQHIQEEIGRYFTRRAEIRVKPTKEDIKNFLTVRLNNVTESRVMNQDLREEIFKTISEKISDIFLLVSLSINAILAQSTIRRRREVLRQMTSGQGMSGAYAATLERIIGQGGDKGKLGMEVLMWVSQSERPLGPEDLCYALSIEEDSTDLDPENTPAIETLLSCCLGLVAVDDGGSRVRLIHLTLQEYLIGRPDLFGSAHAKMAEVCLIYLNSPTIQNLPIFIWKYIQKMPFLVYASCYWGVHARKELTERTKSLALQLLERYDRHISMKVLQDYQRFRTLYKGLLTPTGFTGLHAIACFGIPEIAAAMIESGGCDVNKKDSLGCTPLMWAAKNNNTAVCEVLLELGHADPNIRDSEGETALFMALADGCQGIVNLLYHRE